MHEAEVGGGRQFLSSGRWAGEQLLRALRAGEPISPACLRTADTLRKNEWEILDEALIEEAVIRLTGVADLLAAGLTTPVANAMGKTIFQWETMTDMNEAETSLSGVDRTENDRVDFALNSQPLPITHKDFDIQIRALAASRNPPGEALDTTQARVAGRLVAEKLEKLLFQGGPTFGGSAIYGYTTHPNRNLTQFGSGGELWSAAGHDGSDILADVLAMITALEGDRMFGPYMLYVPKNFNVKLSDDFKANSDLTIRQRLLQIDGIQGVKAADQLPDSKVVLVQMSRDVVTWVNGEPIQSVQWDIEGGFIVKFKAFAIQVPLIRADAQSRCGVCEANATGT
jgi:uncharacterized protein DUF6260